MLVIFISCKKKEIRDIKLMKLIGYIGDPKENAEFSKIFLSLPNDSYNKNSIKLIGYLGDPKEDPEVSKIFLSLPNDLCNKASIKELIYKFKDNFIAYYRIEFYPFNLFMFSITLSKFIITPKGYFFKGNLVMTYIPIKMKMKFYTRKFTIEKKINIFKNIFKNFSK